MRDSVTFVVEGKPRGKGRPRFTMRSGYPTAYTPKETAEYEKQIRDAYLAEGGELHNGGIGIMVSAFYPVPKSATKKDRMAMLDGETFPLVKPDVDNILKVVCDALNGVAYPDDSHILQAVVQKHYASEGYIRVTVSEFSAKDRLKFTAANLSKFFDICRPTLEELFS